MFESLALEDPRNTRRNWMTAVSFALQTTGLALLVLAPIGYTGAVAPRFAEHIVAPIGIASIDTQSTPPTDGTTTTDSIPIHESPVPYINTGHNVHPSPNPGMNTQPVDPNGVYVPGGTNFTRGGPIDRLLAVMKPAVAGPPPTNARTKPIPISHLNPGMLIKQVQPIYPAIAKSTHTQGKVLLVAIIDTEGRITNLRALSGHPFLIPAAINAVEQWRYRPYILNGQPVEVETQITVSFTLQSN